MIEGDMIKKLAELSKIALSDSEEEDMKSDMAEIIGLMDKIGDIDLKKADYRAEAVNYDDLREDFIGETFETEEILKNAKKVKRNSFVVPKVV